MKPHGLALALAIGLVAAPAALAKGPAAASVSGPGDGGGGISITGDGEGGNATPLGRLVEAAGFFAASFGQQPDPMLAERPKGDLGQRYTIAYRVPGPNGRTDTIVQDAYPYAKPAAVTYTEPGQPFFETERTYGGWYVGGAALTEVLVDAGLPPAGEGGAAAASRDAPASARSSGGGVEPAIVAAGVLGLLAAALGVVWFRRRPAATA